MSWIRIGMLFALTATFGVLMATQAQAKTYNPNRLDDPAPNGCQRNDCSLREAVIAANNHLGKDSIVMRAGKRYEITRAGSIEDPDPGVGHLKVTGPLSVSSGGRRHSTVDLKEPDTGQVGFEAQADLSLRGINIVNSISGVFSDDSGPRLTLVDCRIAAQYGVFGFGPTVVRDSTIGPPGGSFLELPPGGISYGLGAAGEFSKLSVSNTRLKNTGYFGIIALDGSQPTTLSHVKVTGSAFAISLSSAAAATLDHVDASDNGFGLQVSSDYPLVVRDSSFERNVYGGVGKYGTSGNVIIKRSRFAQNGFLAGGLTIAGGGDKVSISRVSSVNNTEFPGLCVYGEFRKTSIAQSTFSGNRPTKGCFGDGELDVSLIGGGVAAAVSGELDVSNSTFSGNRAAEGGGARLLSGGRMNLTNSTFANNRADQNGGGLVAGTPSGAVLRSVTIAGNLAGADNSGSHLGGGLAIASDDDSALKMFNSVVALNRVGTGSFAPNCVASSFTLARNNVLGSNDKETCLGFRQANGNRIIKNPKLDKLRNNGGFTKTMCPKAGSPLIDKAVGAPRRDQRGRKRQGKADIGACESKKPGRQRRAARKIAARSSNEAPLDHLDPAFDTFSTEVDMWDWIMSHDVRSPEITEPQAFVLPGELGPLLVPQTRLFGTGGGASVP